MAQMAPSDTNMRRPAATTPVSVHGSAAASRSPAYDTKRHRAVAAAP